MKQIFVDGKSTDGTFEFLRAYIGKTCNTKLLSQTGTGLYQALNEGIQAAVADRDVSYIGMLHSDDLLNPGNFAEYLSKIVSNAADVFYSDIEFHEFSGKVVRVWRSGEFSKFKLKTGWMPPHTSMIVSKRVYEEVGLYNPAFGTAADYEWIVRVLTTNHDSIRYFPKPTVSMLVGGASNTSLKARLRANAMDGKVWASRFRLQSALIRVCKPMRKIGQFVIFTGSK